MNALERYRERVRRDQREALIWKKRARAKAKASTPLTAAMVAELIGAEPEMEIGSRSESCRWNWRWIRVLSLRSGFGGAS